MVILESLPDSTGAGDLVTNPQTVSPSRAAQAGSKVAGKTAGGIEPKQSLGKKRLSAAGFSLQGRVTEVVEISDDDDNDFLPDPKLCRRQ